MSPASLSQPGVKEMTELLTDVAKDPSGDLIKMANEYKSAAEKFQRIALPILNRPVCTVRTLHKSGLQQPANEISMLRNMCSTMFGMEQVKERFKADDRLPELRIAVSTVNEAHKLFDDVMRKVCRVTGRQFVPTALVTA